MLLAWSLRAFLSNFQYNFRVIMPKQSGSKISNLGFVKRKPIYNEVNIRIFQPEKVIPPRLPMHSFEVNIRICQPEKVMSTEAKVDTLSRVLTEKECINCSVI